MVEKDSSEVIMKVTCCICLMCEVPWGKPGHDCSNACEGGYHIDVCKGCGEEGDMLEKLWRLKPKQAEGVKPTK